MAANYFDQFDPATAKPAAGSANFFDQFDAGSAKPGEPATPGLIPTIKRTGGQMLTTAATTLEDVARADVAQNEDCGAGQECRAQNAPWFSAHSLGE